MEPSLFYAVWRHRRVVALAALSGVILGVALGIVAALFAPVTAEASFVLRRPSSLSLDSPFNETETARHVADQVEIIQSPEVMQQAANGLMRATGTRLTLKEFDSALTIRWSRDSTVATAAFTTDREEVALAATTSLLEAYQNLLIDQTTSSGNAAIEVTNRAIEVKEQEMNNLESRLATLNQIDSPEMARLTELAGSAAAISGAMVTASAAAREELQGQLQALTVEMDILRTLIEATPRQPEILQLERRLEQALAEQDVLIARRSNLEIDETLNRAPTVVFSPARLAEADGLALPVRYGFAGAILVAIGAAAWAHLREQRRMSVTSAGDPEALIGSPLLAEIPDFDDEKVYSQLPVRDEPRSTVAEGFRFLAAATEIRVADLNPRSIAIVGTAVGVGKSTTAANLALASARQGVSVLLVDADFGNQALSQMFGLDSVKIPGITDLIAGSVSLEEAGTTIPGVEGELALIGRGRTPAIAPSLFRTDAAKDVFEDLAKNFDLVIVDTPPLLQVAYAMTLVSHVGGSIVVIPKESLVDDVVATAARLRSIGATIIGYAIVHARPSSASPVAEGSLRDVLGDSGFVAPQRSRSRG